MLRQMELPDVRRHLRAVIEEAKRQSAERRVRTDEASRAYDVFLPEVAVPAFHAVAQALTGESYRFKVTTPGDAVRLMPEFSNEDFIELALDTTGDVPALLLTSSRGRGRRKVVTEQPVFAGRPIADLSQDDVILAVVAVLPPFVER
jgi:hypothetical protein